MSEEKKPLNITLILACTVADPLRNNEPFMPLSLPLLAGTAPNNNYTLIDMLAGEDVDYDKHADIVGISSRISAESQAYAIADKFRSKGVKVILGGPHISSVPFKAIEHADAVVIGEGEPVWPLIVEDARDNKLKDFYLYSPREFDPKGRSLFHIKSYYDLKNVPVPSRNLYKKRYNFDTLFATRGCPIDCDFCSVPLVHGKKLRSRPVEDVVKEVDSFKGLYYLLDDTVFGRPSNYDYYLQLYDEIIKLKKKRFWTGQANLDAAANPKGQEVIKRAAKSGLIYAAIGIESVNPVVLQNAGTIAKMGADSASDVILKMKENIRFIQAQGIFISGWFTIGYDEDSIETYYQTLEFCNEMSIFPVISTLEALPGTRLYNKLKEQNRIDYNKAISTVHPTMKDVDVLEALKDVNKKGFSFSQVWKKTIYFSRRIKNENLNLSSRIHYKIYKTIFVFILQLKLRKGLSELVNRGKFEKLNKST